MFKKLFFASLFWGGALAAVAQPDGYLKCGTVEAIEHALELHPELILNIQNLDRETKEYLMGEDKALDSTITIPVVFHVFHTYGSERISEAQIRDAIRIINEDFQNRNADSNSVSAPFRPIVGRPQIRFRLAKRDPNGRCTKGVNYINSPLHTSAGENLKSVISWDTRRYLNFWVCSNIASGAAAYAYYPGTAPSQSAEGIVTRHDYTGSIGTSQPGYAARTLTHELGHYFNLPHTWGSSNTPGVATNCNLDDGVADTPNCVGVTGSGCNLNQTTCGSLDNVENHMEYSSCRRMFTMGQVTRMHAAVNSNIGFRRSLWQGSNLVATGTTNDGPGPECPITPDFRSSITRACVGQEITFTSLAYNVDNINAVSYRWEFQGGNPSTSTLRNPVVSYDAPGVFNVKMVVSNSAGADSLIRSAFITIQPDLVGYTPGEPEGFEVATFPLNQSSPEKSWEITGSGTNNWRRTTLSSGSGQASLFVNNASNNGGNVTTLFSPIYEINGSNEGARLAFKYAFAKRNTQANTDRLQVSYSVNCGVSWTSLFNKTANALTTTTSTYPSTFLPTASEWKQENVNVLFLGNNSRFRLRFQFTAGGGNNIYLDDIMLTTLTSVEALKANQPDFVIVPNPSHQNLPNILWSSTNNAIPEEIQIQDVMGREVFRTSLKQNFTEENLFDLNRHMEKPKSGQYFIKLKFAEWTAIKPWIVLP